MKDWKSSLIALLLVLAQAFIDYQKGVKPESLVGYVAAAGLHVAADKKKEDK